MADNEQKALQLMAEAEKKLTTNKGFFGSLFGCVFFTRTILLEKSMGLQVSKWSSTFGSQAMWNRITANKELHF